VICPTNVRGRPRGAVSTRPDIGELNLGRDLDFKDLHVVY
jgi:hypothetical protein